MNKFKTFINNLGNYLTKLQIKIVSLIDKDSLWHDYLGSWIMLVMFGYCILFKVDIYLIPISVILAGISKECIDKYIRKVKPLNRALEGAKIWITGLRSEQSEIRENMKMIEWDDDRKLFKFNPLIHWTYQDVLDYIEQHNVQDLPLHKKGFISVGCKPCTRAIAEGENPRAGRWFWEESQKECGLHSQ